MLETAFARFTALFNEIYEGKIREEQADPSFSLIRMCAIMWRRRVFTPLETVLRENVINLMGTIREENLQKARIITRKPKKEYTNDPRVDLLAQ